MKPMKINGMLFRQPMMRAAVLALCTSAVGTPAMLAQDTPPPPPQQQDQAGPQGGRRGGAGGEERQVEMLTKRLSLTPDQVTQVKAIEDDSRTQSMAVRDDTTVAQPDKRGKTMEIRKAAQDKVRAVLTDDQKTKFDAMQAEMQRRRAAHQGGPGGSPPPAPQA